VVLPAIGASVLLAALGATSVAYTADEIGPAQNGRVVEFTDIGAGLTAVDWGSVAWGDYDSDGDLDVLLTRWTGSSRISRVYRSEHWTPNTAPASPSNLSCDLVGNTTTFSWDAATGRTAQALAAG
jgi:hypothetical protein